MTTDIWYEIRIQEHLADGWSDWFGGLSICYDENGGTVRAGPVCDQAALMGLLNQLQALNLTLVSVIRLPED